MSETYIRPIAINRKNSLFSDSVAGAEASAIIFSIVNTAVVNNIDPYKYLELIFKQLPNINFMESNEKLDEFLPWSKMIQQKCCTKNANTEINRNGLYSSEPA